MEFDFYIIKKIAINLTRFKHHLNSRATIDPEKDRAYQLLFSYYKPVLKACY